MKMRRLFTQPSAMTFVRSGPCAPQRGGGVLGALGVLATNYASRVRDHRIEVAKSLASLGIDMVEGVQRTLPLA